MDILIDSLLDNQNLAVPGYFAQSTAPSDVEKDVDSYFEDTDRPTINEVIDRLYENRKTNRKNLGLVIAIHGYNTGVDGKGFDGVREYWYKPLCEYINRDPFIQKQQNNSVFLGYRWPSERVLANNIPESPVADRQKPNEQSGNTIRSSLKALPVLLKIALFGGMAITATSLLLLLWNSSPLLLILALSGIVASSFVLTLFVLRIIVYFRDGYRANNFGVPDLVELIRQLDQGLVARRVQELLTDDILYDRIAGKIPEIQTLDRAVFLQVICHIQRALSKLPDLEINRENLTFQRVLKRLKQKPEIATIDEETLTKIIERLVLVETLENDAAQRFWRENPIQLSFIGHSMGAHVTTQVIRILSDVFDPRSVGSVGSSKVEKLPSSRVGRVFCLGRLVLIAPDIPLLTITSGRANFLRSSLRRFEEAYLFSNEGDLALRIASTTANYFSFPAKSRTQGYRLGNVTVRPQGKAQKAARSHGIVNLEKLPHLPIEHLLPYLEVNDLKNSKQSLDPTEQRNEESIASGQTDKESIADLFTYFDCTEYCDFADYNDKARQQAFNVLIGENQRSPLSFFNYLRLLVQFATFSNEKFPKTKDVHGGYFWGQMSKLLLYRLAFVGFQELLDSLLLEPPTAHGIHTALPQDLEADLVRVRAMPASDSPTSQSASSDPQVVDQKQLLQLQEKRQVALRYLSWLCQSKRVQMVVSPERYQVDVLGRDRDEVREAILLREDQ